MPTAWGPWRSHLEVGLGPSGTCFWPAHCLDTSFHSVYCPLHWLPAARTELGGLGPTYPRERA